MNDQILFRLIDAGHLIVITAFPALFVFSPSLARLVRSTSLRFVLAIIFTWVFLNFWRPCVEVPAVMAAARASGNMDYDGVGGNVVTLMFGWAEPLIFGLPFFIIKLIVNQRMNPNHTSESR